MTYLFSNTIAGNVNIYNSNGASITTSQPLPVTLGSNTITITGNVNVGTVVQVNSTPENPVHVHLDEIGTSGILAVPYLPIGGNVVVTSGNLVIGANVTVSVNNFPATQNVSFANQSFAIYNSNNVPVTNSNPLSVQVVSNTTNYVYAQFAPTWQLDALSKLRVSTIGYQDYFSPVVDDDITYRWSQVLSGTNSNSFFLANTSELQMTSGNTASGSAIRQTYVKYKIVPGTAHTIFSTVNFNANNTETGVTRRTGLFDQNNGLFWEQNANTLAVVVRRQIANGSIVEDRTYANSFNTDKLDGTGPTGFNIFSHGLNNYYTFWFDFIGGKTGRIRFGMGGPNGPQICHVASYSGNNANTTTFINDSSLPLRREIFNSTSQTASPSFNMTGISFQAEAPILFNPSPTSSYNINGYIPGASLTPILTIGLRAGAPYTGSDISPNEFSIVDTNNQGKNQNPATFFYQVIYNANVNGTYAYSGNGSVSNTNVGRSSKMWNWPNTATISGGLVLLSGITQSGVGQNNLDGIPKEFNLGSDINGNPATLTLAVQQLAAGGNFSNVVCTFNFLEEL